MSEHKVAISWKRTTDNFDYDTFNRDHSWKIEGGETIQASSAPAFLGSADRIDPEEALVAALSSCHMLTFLALAAKKRLSVDSYNDDAVGYLEKNDEGKLAITRVALRPKVTFSGDKQPDSEQIEKMHHRSHDACFIANSVKTEVVVETP